MPQFCVPYNSQTPQEFKQEGAVCLMEMALLEANMEKVAGWGSGVESSPAIPTLQKDSMDSSPAAGGRHTAASETAVSQK